MNELLTIYFLLINVVGFIIFAIDKRRANRHKQRISERTLWLIAFIGGAMGSYLAMHVIRHKNKKPIFVIGFALLIVINVLLFVYLLNM